MTAMKMLIQACRLIICVCMLLSSFTLLPAQAQDGESGTNTFAFEEKTINEGLPDVTSPLRLDTPRATIETFLDAVRQDDFLRAGRALNLNAIPVEEQAARAPELALQMAFILRRHDLIVWNDLPDQPDARVLPGLQQSSSPYSRRSVELGVVNVGGRPVPISLQRFMSPDSEAVWLFSPFAVKRVPDLYGETEHDFLSRWYPLRERVDMLGKPSVLEWTAAAILSLLALLFWFSLAYIVRAIIRKLPLRYWSAARRITIPFATIITALLFRVCLTEFVILTGPVASWLDIASEAIGLVAGAWLIVQLSSTLSLALSQKYVVPLGTEDPENRRFKTTMYVVRRLALVAVALLSIGYILLRVEIFESFGISVLASAGALGVLVAIAARPLLGNMVSGLQIALTDPVRIGDVVVYDDQWATVEDISFAHTVLRTLTETRLIVPHSDFLSRPFENWSKDGEEVRRIVKIPVDYRIDVEKIRQKVEEIVEADPRATEQPPEVEMVELTEEVAILWVWVSGTTALTSWYLHNEVREKLVAYIRELEGGVYLPRRRHLVLGQE